MPDIWPWTIAGAALVAAIAATLKSVGDAYSLKKANDEIAVLKSKIARLEIVDSEQKKTVTDDFTKPLRYPKL